MIAKRGWFCAALLVSGAVMGCGAEAYRVSTVAGTNFETFTGDGGPATKAILDEPRGIAVDSQGNLYIAERPINSNRTFLPSGRLRRVDVEGNITSLRVPAKWGSDVLVRGILAVAADRSGNVYVENYVVNLGGIVWKVAPSGVLSPVKLKDESGAEVNALPAYSPFTVDGEGNLYYVL